MTSVAPRRDTGLIWVLLGLAAVSAASVRRLNRPLPERAGGPAEGSRPRGVVSPTTRDAGAAAREPGRGREADTPTAIPGRGWKDIFWRSYAEINDDRVLAVGAGVTFYLLLAIVPFIAAFVSLYGLVADPASVQQHLESLSGVLPPDALSIVGEQMKRLAEKSGDTLSVGFIASLAVALWSANAGMKAIFDALNVAYDETEKRGFLVLNAASLAFTLGAIVFLAAAIGAIVVIPAVLAFVGLGSATELILRLARWPALLLVLMLGLSVLYRFGPSRTRARWRWLSVGSATAALLFVVVSLLFSWYAENFGSYDETYGSLGAVVAFMTWTWISAVVVLVGAELNAEIEHQTARDSTVGPEKPLGRRGATMADTVGPAQN